MLKGVRKRQLTSFGEFGLAADGFVNLEWSVLWPQFKWCCCWSLEGCEGLQGSLEGIGRRLNRLEMGLEGLRGSLEGLRGGLQGNRRELKGQGPPNLHPSSPGLRIVPKHSLRQHVLPGNWHQVAFQNWHQEINITKLFTEFLNCVMIRCYQYSPKTIMRAVG